MQMTTEARAWLDSTVRRILARHPIGDPERAGITYELMSHLHGAGESRATAAGRAEVTREDLEAALADAGGEAALADAFVKPLARPIERAPMGSRFGALLIDAFVVLIGVGALHTALDILMRTLMGIMSLPAESSPTAPDMLLPWGYHDPTMPLPIQAVYQLASGALVLGYFAWFEAHEGRTLGKRALSLRVVRGDGMPMTYRESVVRNLSKLSPPIFVLDVVVGLLAFSKESQRVSDKIAGTLVVRA